jgi:hypothetical protein
MALNPDAFFSLCVLNNGKKIVKEKILVFGSIFQWLLISNISTGCLKVCTRELCLVSASQRKERKETKVFILITYFVQHYEIVEFLTFAIGCLKYVHM